MELYLIRHGRTDENVKGVYLGISDIHLSEQGKYDAYAVNKKMENIDINKVYVSPLSRCTETADIIFPNRDREVIEDFKEINFGEWECKSYKEIGQLWSKEFKCFIDDFENFKFPRGESFKEFYIRVINGFNKIKSEESVAIIAHEGTLRVIISYLLGINEKGFYKFKFQHGCYSKVQVYNNDCQIMFVNL